MGFVIVSFKERRCVLETLEEIDLVKQDLISRGKLEKLGIENWEAMNAYAPSDIIWEDIHHISVQNSILANLSVPFASSLMSVTSFVALLYIEMESANLKTSILGTIMNYLTPLIMATLTLYLFPMNVFCMTQSE